MHLIQFPKGKDYGRAIRTLLEVPRTQYVALPDYTMVVVDEHIEALKNARVSFAYLSKTEKPNGRATKRTSVRS